MYYYLNIKCFNYVVLFVCDYCYYLIGYDYGYKGYSYKVVSDWFLFVVY